MSNQGLDANDVRARRLGDLDRAHLIHPNLSGDVDERCIIVRGEGCLLWDADGRELLDATGGLWLTQIGHGRKEMADVAARQTRTLEYSTSFWEFSNDQSILLAARLAELAPEGIDKIFFTSGGSESNDTAIKAVRLFHHRRGESDRNWIISRRSGYHGTTYGAGSATGFDEYHHGYGPNLPHVAHVTPPWPYRSELYAGEDPTDFLLAELERTITDIGPGRVAAMIAEPIMGVGGVLIPPPDYWPRVRELTRRHGILLIADEVVSGFGRTGVWFASEVEGMEADLIVTAKGLTSGYAPLGAVLMRSDIGEALASGEGFHHGYTYFGHPVACAVARENIAIIEREDLLARALEIGDQFWGELRAASTLPIVGEIRGRGSIVALELVSDRETRAPMSPTETTEIARTIRREHGVIMRDIGNILVFSPPLVISTDQIKQAVDAATEVLSRVAADGRGRSALSVSEDH